MDILELLKKYGLDAEVEGFDTDAFNTEFRKSFKSDVELKKVQTKLTALQGDYDTLKEESTNFETTLATITKDKETLEGELTGFKTEQQASKEKSLYDEAFKGVEFTSDRVKKAIISEMKDKGITEVEGKLEGVDTFLQELYTEDKSLFKSVDATLHTWSGGAGDTGEKDKKVTTNLFNRIL